MASGLEKSFAIRSVTPTTSTWVEMAAPIRCSQVTIINQATVDIKFRTDSTNSASEFTIPANDSYVVQLPTIGYDYRQNNTFAIGNTVGYVQLSASGSGTVAGAYVN